MKTVTDQKRIEEILDRGVLVEFLPTRKEFLEKMMSGERLRIYIGADPTSESLHLSHAKNYILLEEFRQLGHEVIILVGDFTARIGDPTDRTAARVALSSEEVKKNVEGWVSQIKPLLNFDDVENPPRIVYNSDWLARLSFEEVISIASNFTVQQMLERDMFEKRLKENTPIYLHEFFYPLMQGYDSVVLDVDAELCGTDQTFNALAGRTLLKRLKDKEKFVLVVGLMANPKTGEMMSKSKGTGVFLSWSAEKMYGAIMAQPDEMTEIFFINLTRITLEEIKNIMAEEPMEAKSRAAYEIVKKIYGEEKARVAEKEFTETFRKGGAPEYAPEIFLEGGESLSDKLVEAKIVSSKTDWRRLVSEGAVCDTNNNKITDVNFLPKETITLKIGKRRFVKINKGI